MSIIPGVRRSLAAVVTASLTLAALAGPAHAGTRAAARPAAPAPSADPAARIATLSALVDQRRAAQVDAIDRRDLTARRLVEARANENLAIQEADRLRRAAETARAEYQAARSHVADVAAAAYRRAGSSTPVADLLDAGAAAEAGYRQTIVSRVHEHETEILRAARAARRAAVAAEHDADAAKVAWHDRVQQLTRLLPEQAAAVEALQAGISNARFWLSRWQSIGAGVNTSIMGSSVLGPSEIAAWFEGTRRRARITVSVSELARDYIEEGEAAKVRGDIAFAQSILETGSFYFPDGGQLTPTDNNFAGMDACDSCAHGRSFPDARTGVRAQLQQLRVYADPTVTNASFDPPPVVANLDRHHLKGRVPTWNGLTHTWATANTYGDRIIAIYAQMLAWLTDRADI